MVPLRSQTGYTLIELVVVIIIISILAAVAVKSLGKSGDLTRLEETREEMDRLAYAIAGNPDLVSGGYRTDFGYVGDVGALPADWQALLTNPGGYLTWNGPYIIHDLDDGSGADALTRDAWGHSYTPPGCSFSSVGGPEPLTRVVATSLAGLMSNRVLIAITDLNQTPPGDSPGDSALAFLTYPDGHGGYTAVQKRSTPGGLVTFDSVPIGIHTLRVVFYPGADTLIRQVVINPGQDRYADIQHFADLW